MNDPIPSLDPFQSQLDKLLNEVSVLAVRLRQDARRVQSVDDLPTGGVNVLRMLSRCGTLTVPQMARLDSTSRQNIQTVVNRLEREGCVESAPNPAHRRSDLIRITDRGMASLATVSRNKESYKDKVGASISAEALSRASEVLRQIREALCTAAATNGKLKREVPQGFSKPLRPKKSYLGPKVREHRPEPVQIENIASEENELPVSLL